MNKDELIRTISQETERIIPQEKIALVLNKAVEVMKRTLDSGEAVKWQGFGTLTVKEKPPRRIYSQSEKSLILSKGSRCIIFRESPKKKDN
mgnify:CR=1 FL=1